MRAEKKKIGFLGGTFDPVHLGHLLMAQDAFEEKNLERVYFIPAARNPLKTPPPEASPEDRLAMLERAMGDDPRFGLLDWEIAAGGSSYTVETARRLRDHFRGVELYWIIGADQLAELPRWHQADALARLMGFLCAVRPGSPAAVPEIEDLRVEFLRGHPFQVSSSEIRGRIKEQLLVDLFLPVPVASYIQSNNLYV